MVAELLEFENTVEDADGRSHVATVLGREADDGTWIGWVRFRGPTGEILETGRETTQPNRQTLAYWAGGLTYYYLEGALARARRRQAAAVPDADGEPPARAAHATPPAAARAVPRLEVLSRTPAPLESIMGVAAAPPGTSREIADAGVVVYEGAQAEDDLMRYVFSVQFGSENAGAILSNWLWSRLHDVGGNVRVNGAPVEVRNDALKRALVGR
jgi:hypothetical protein